MAPSWSWNLPDSQLGWESKMEQSVAIMENNGKVPKLRANMKRVRDVLLSWEIWKFLYIFFYKLIFLLINYKPHESFWKYLKMITWEILLYKSLHDEICTIYLHTLNFKFRDESPTSDYASSKSLVFCQITHSATSTLLTSLFQIE